MDRRDFLKAGTAGLAGVSLTEAGCATEKGAQARAVPQLDPDAVEKMLEKVDRRMSWINERPRDFIVPGLVGRTPTEEAVLARHDRLFREAMRTFYMTGVFLELDEADRLHPGFQERLSRLEPEMDRALRGMTDLLASLTTEQMTVVQQTLKKEPDVGTRAGEIVSTVAKEDGFTFGRRFDLRLAVTDVSNRMRTQHPSVFIDSLVRKVRRIEATDAEQVQREWRVKMGEEAFWELHHRSLAIARDWSRIYETRPRTDVARLERIYPAGSGGDSLVGPQRIMTAGFVLLGIGVVFEAVGIPLLFATSGTANVVGAVLGVTLGPTLLVAGIVMAIVGGVILSHRKEQERMHGIPLEDEQLPPDQPPPLPPPPAYQPNQTYQPPAFPPDKPVPEDQPAPSVQ